MNVYQGRHMSPLLSPSFWFCGGSSDLQALSAGSLFTDLLSSSDSSTGYGRFLLTYWTSGRAFNWVLPAVFVITDNGFILMLILFVVGSCDGAGGGGGGSVVEVTCGCCNVTDETVDETRLNEIDGIIEIDPPLGGVGNALRKLDCNCNGGVVVNGW